jgi:hypothetical protein
MSIDLTPLLETAVFETEVNNNASVAVELALEAYEGRTHFGARPFEVVVPDDVDELWVRTQLAPQLIYYCESEGLAIPKCAGVLLIAFVGNHLYAIPAEATVAWISDLLDTSMDHLRRDFGTHEIETALR